LQRAWHGRGERRSPENGRPPDAPTIEAIVRKKEIPSFSFTFGFPHADIFKEF